MPLNYDLAHMDPNAFEHMVNMLALRVLGAGHTGFGPGGDGGRDGYFHGEAPYPSDSERWAGTWYIQSKFHAPKLSGNSQRWLLNQINSELAEFAKPDTKRVWPDIWIVATNVDPSGAPRTGAFDKARELVRQKRPELAERFHIWGGGKIVQLLALHPEVAQFYAHFITPGHILTELLHSLGDDRVTGEQILRFFVVRGLTEHQYTKLEQAGASSDTRPGVHKLFVDLPFKSRAPECEGMAAEALARTLARTHKNDQKTPAVPGWQYWNLYPTRAHAWFLKGGPGQGKSTVGQYLAQIHRAATLLNSKEVTSTLRARELAGEIRATAITAGLWPAAPRVPVSIELKEYAEWLGRRDPESARGLVTYLAERISVGIEQTVSVGTLRRVLASNRWFIVLDGLDEVPQDVKDTLAEEILTFVDHVLVELDADVFTLCTSRPQGYSGQFDDLDAPTIMLVPLAPAHALACAAPVLALDRTDLEAQASLNLLKAAIESSAVRELMTSPLQSHIMAVVVRDGGRPPERRWQLFSNFYQVIRRREANKPLLDPRFAKLLREEEGLLKSVHNRLGFVLHARAERSAGAQTKMDRAEFRSIVMEAVMQMMDTDFERTVDTLMDATTERLVLVSTPDDGQHVRFDVRPLQEFFAAEFLYEAVGVDELRKRVEVIAGDAHWREVMHFLLSALIESGRRTELLVITRVLEALDDEDSEFGFRQIAKRMARGALLCSRLIEEGVVEQDKRYREQFVRSLQGLFGTVEVGLFTTLSAFRPGQSRKWFVRQLFAALKDFTPAENVGACLALCFILSDEDEDEGKLLKQHLLESPDSYLSYILFSTFIYTDEEASNPLKTWLASTSVTILSGQRWKELSPDTIRGITELLAMDRNLTLSVAADLGCNDAERTLLSEIVCAPEFSELRKAQYGRFQVFEYPQDWTTPFDFRSPELELAAYATGVSGYFELVQLVLRYARSRTANDLRTILMNHDRVHQILPRHLAALIPGGPRDLSELKTVGDESLRKLVTLQMLEGRYMRRPFYHFGPLLPSSSEPLEWLFLEYYPQHWADLLSGDSPDALHRRKKFTERLRNDPGLLCDCIADIPSLQELCPEIRDFIPSALRSVCAVAQPVSWPPRLPNVAVLEFPEDAPILPHIVAPAFARLRYYSEEEASNRTQRLIQWVERFFPDSSPLRVISDDVQQAPATRVAAIFLLLLHRSSGASLECDGERLVDLVVSSRTEWMIQALSVYLERFTDRKDPNAQKTVAHLLEATREDYPAREQVQWVITSWREESSAPVTDRGVLAAWLAEGT